MIKDLYHIKGIKCNDTTNIFICMKCNWAHLKDNVDLCSNCKSTCCEKCDNLVRRQYKDCKCCSKFYCETCDEKRCYMCRLIMCYSHMEMCIYCNRYICVTCKLYGKCCPNCYGSIFERINN
jgi:hypothetical protein